MTLKIIGRLDVSFGPTSYNVHMQGWFKAEIARASLSHSTDANGGDDLVRT